MVIEALKNEVLESTYLLWKQPCVSICIFSVHDPSENSRITLLDIIFFEGLVVFLLLFESLFKFQCFMTEIH
jgi:hypothetical protein